MGMAQASQYSSRSLLAWDQSIVGIYHIKNPSKTKTKERTSAHISLWASEQQYLQFTDLLVCLHMTLGPTFKH